MRVADLPAVVAGLFGSVDRPARGGRLRPDDVLTFLGGGELPPASERAVLAILEQVQVLVAEPRVRARFDGMSGYVRRLPRIIFLSRRGASFEAIAEQLGGLATPYGVEVTLTLLARSVAERVNRAA